MIDTLDQSKQLIGYGGKSEIEAFQDRIREGFVEARLSADRWELLGFDDREFKTGLKVYQAEDWHKRDRSDPAHHPKIEASFEGTGSGEMLPHIDEWDSVLVHLRTVVATHCRWSGIDPRDLVADDFQDGAGQPEFEFFKPTGRRDQLRARYEDMATKVYREAVSEHSIARYDILSIIAQESGATYDQLEDRTGLARSTVRYHVRQLSELGIVARVGNPVVVVFVSRYLLDRAREIVREARPRDDLRDMKERAEERRKRRENLSDDQSDTDSEDSAEDSNSVAESDAESGASDASDDWMYFSQTPESFSPIDLASLLEVDDLDGQDVRIRRPAVDPFIS